MGRYASVIIDIALEKLDSPLLIRYLQSLRISLRKAWRYAYPSVKEIH